MQAEQTIYEQLGGGRVNYRTTETVDRRATRTLFYPLDVLSSSRKQEFPKLRHGGDELAVPTNSLYKGYLPRCAFVPLEVAPSFLPVEFVREGAEILQVDEPVVDLEAWRGRPGVGVYGASNLRGVAQYPADDIKTVQSRNNDSGMQKGIREINALRGVQWTEELFNDLQLFFFPNFDNHDATKPRVPEKLEAVEDLIRDGIKRYQNGARIGELDLAKIGQEMLESCDTCRNWATVKIGVEHALLEIGTTPMGYTYTYSELAEVLLPQLGIERQDAHLRNQKRQNEDNSENLSKLTELVSQMVMMQVGQMQNQGQSLPNQDAINEMVAKALQAHKEVSAVVENEAPPFDLRTKEGKEWKARQEKEAADRLSNDG